MEPEGEVLVSRLSAKVRDQARRLASLQVDYDSRETYIKLCERRVKELDPSQEIPIAETHIGRHSSIVVELEETVATLRGKLAASEQRLRAAARDENNAAASNVSGRRTHSGTVAKGGGGGGGTAGLLKATSVLQQQAEQLAREKRALEQHLRSETMRAEELRGYVAVLEEALDVKARDLGLDVGDGQAKLLAEVAKLRMSLAASQHGENALKSEAASSAAQLLALEQENGALSASVRDAEEKLALLTVELQRAGNADLLSDYRKLESEKLALVDYVQDTLDRMADMAKELETSKEREARLAAQDTERLKEVARLNTAVKDAEESLRKHVEEASRMQECSLSAVGAVTTLQSDVAKVRQALELKEIEAEELSLMQADLLERLAVRERESKRLSEEVQVVTSQLRLAEDKTAGHQREISGLLLQLKSSLASETEHKMKANEAEARLGAVSNDLMIALAEAASLKTLRESEAKRLQTVTTSEATISVQLPALKAEVEALRGLRSLSDEVEERVREEVTGVMQRRMRGPEAASDDTPTKPLWPGLAPLKQLLPGLAVQASQLVVAWEAADAAAREQAAVAESVRKERESQRAVLYEEIHHLRRQLDASRSELSALHGARSEASSLQSHLTREGQRVIELQATLEAREAAVHELSSHVAAIEKERDALRVAGARHVELASEQAASLEKLSGQASALVLAKEELERRLADSERALLNEKDSAAAARLEKRVFMEKVTSLEKTLDGQRDLVVRLAEAEDAEIAVRESHEELRAALEGAKGATQALQDKVDRLTAEGKESEGKYVALERERQAVSSELQRARSESLVLQEKVLAALHRLRESDGAALGGHLAAHSSSAPSNLMDMVQKLTDAAQTAYVRVSDAERRLRLAEESRDELQLRFGRASARLHDVDRAARQLEEAEAALKQARLQADSSRQEQTRLLARLSQQDRELGDLRHGVHEARLQAQREKAELLRVQSELDSVEHELAEALEEVAFTREDLSIKENVISRQKAELDAVTAALGKGQATRAASHRDTEELERELLDTLTENDQLRSQIASLEDMHRGHDRSPSLVTPHAVRVHRNGSIDVTSQHFRDSRRSPIYASPADSDRDAAKLEETLSRIQATFASLKRS